MDSPGGEGRDALGGLGRAQAMQTPLPARAIVSPRSKQVGIDPPAPGLALVLMWEGLTSLLFGPLLSISAVTKPDWKVCRCCLPKHTTTAAARSPDPGKPWLLLHLLLGER